MKRKTSVLRGLNDIRESYILESEIPAANAAWANAESKPTPKETWRRVVSSGWFAAAVCAVVAFGTLGGIIMAGHLAADPTQIPPAETVVPNNTLTEESEAGSEPDNTVVAIRVTHRQVGYDAEGNETLRIEYTYDNSGNLVSEIMYQNGKKESKSTYIYNDNNLKIKTEQKVYIPSASSQTYTYEYDEDGHLIKECTYDYRDKLVHEYAYEYDKEGRLIKTEREDWVKTCTYGEHGSYVELLVMKASGKTEKTEVTKDEYGNILRECYYTDDVLTIERVYEYNESHQKIKCLPYYDGELGGCWIYEYENDRLITFYTYLKNELSIYITHEYNEFGELIRRETRDADDNLISSIVWEYGGIVLPAES